MSAALRVVRAIVEQSPEQELTVLFRREEALARDLAEVRSDITAARLRYMAKHRTYGVRVERLRAELL